LPGDIKVHTVVALDESVVQADNLCP
jgi:hypothetical protein